MEIHVCACVHARSVSACVPDVSVGISHGAWVGRAACARALCMRMCVRVAAHRRPRVFVQVCVRGYVRVTGCVRIVYRPF